MDIGALAIAGLVAFLASIFGGLTGFGVGLILPVALASVVSIAEIIPVMAVATLLTNLSRAWAFRRHIDGLAFRALILGALPMALFGALLYTRLPERAVAAMIGALALVMLPLRRYAHLLELKRFGLVGIGVVYGTLAGVASGAGLIMLAGLMAARVLGAAMVATDASVGTLINLTKVLVFGSGGLLDARLIAIGLLVGLCTVPGAYAARGLLKHVSLQAHVWIMEILIAASALWFLWRGFA